MLFVARRGVFEPVFGRFEASGSIRELDDRNFSKKFLTTGIIEKLNEVKRLRGHRPPFSYSFNKKVYTDELNNG